MSPARTDWLVGADRRVEAAERIYSAAAEMAARDGFDALDIDALAARVHCSRATIYRHAGGKAQIRDAVLARLAASIVEEVRRAVAGLTGSERVLTAITVALQRIRADPMFALLLGALRSGAAMADLTQSPVPAAFATELTGLAEDDPAASAWIVRLVLSLLVWPGPDEATEQQMLRRFVAPAFGGAQSY
ncbi:MULTISPECIES: TetR/AcrR family transcriptional regulator [Mycolicibacterium]|uniref:TetR family transcriptional regulator n=2 Tax=Mycolicibacterium TaxID=1866885 RepID=A0A378SX54_9MYCO|nr:MULTISPECIES: TetR/AcrR family transcriptional regulator [Mycolicibacterium]MCV7334652.1 helix-turn-helix transcriptional regulator [Mycolicibacterium senegalense]MDR7291877.1 AcrR family transcriptional regulator [Mycolicibacterium senegalense]QZA23312.1 TetR/AcrR family transcriptional regulator [Mycolicibacterium senegalense]QZH60565.1 TetR/AcrR family transcriptional regulator [Mycolicibacterium farcinogenes]QZH67750.1 TetR/AcrR family transcriptional regulator [Mycolicibacterium farcin